MKTRTLGDDKDWDGFSVEVKWKGGSANSYGGSPVLVDSVRVRNPYAIAALYNYDAESIPGRWVFPYTVLANNKLWLQIHAAERLTFDRLVGTDIVIDDPPSQLHEIMGPFTLRLENFTS
ncbi:MAG: hypothetical protein RMJ28_07945, partial [Nitrososphaerota archaeon]|nr:hypothetical protein [Nitrososphaerota archaeon]